MRIRGAASSVSLAQDMEEAFLVTDQDVVATATEADARNYPRSFARPRKSPSLPVSLIREAAQCPQTSDSRPALEIAPKGQTCCVVNRGGL